MARFFREFFYYSRSERRGILLLAACIVLVLVGGKFIRHCFLPEEKVEQQRLLTETGEEECRQFAALQQQKGESLQGKHTAARTTSTRTASQRWADALRPEPFNPNIADSVTFCRIGLPAWMARNILRYRERGGRFRQPEEFRKIYGLTEEQYQRLEPYIQIEAEKKPAPVANLYGEETGKPEAEPEREGGIETDRVVTTWPVIEKYPAGTLVELNAADTTELKKIPGIGSVIARRMVEYRQRLGGFYSLEQLYEIRLDAQQLASWFVIDTTTLQRIDFNRASMERLRRHPYINFYQAKVVVEHRKKHGRLQNLKALSLYEEFTPDDLERISHYARFD